MLVRYSVLADASGSFGGLVASHGRSGQYIRARVRPTNPSSPAQVAVRTIFANLSSAWAMLTNAQRDAWVTYATNVPATNALGDPLILTGHQMYIRSNAARVQAGLARVDDGPTVFAGDSYTSLNFIPNSGTQLIETNFDNTDPWANEVGGALLAYTSRQVSVTRRYFNGPYRFAGVVLGAVSPPEPSTEGLLQTPFALNLGNFVFARLFTVRADGRLSTVASLGPQEILEV